MAIFITTGGSLSDGAGGGSTQKDLAPDGYDYYILQDGSGDYTEVDTGLAAILGMGAGYYEVYVGPGDFSVNWVTPWPASVTMTLHGAGKDATKFTMSGSTEFGARLSFVDLAYIHFSATDWDGYLEFSGDAGSGAPHVLPDGSVTMGSFHDCRITCNTTAGLRGFAFAYLSDRLSIYNCEFECNHGVVDGDAMLWVWDGVQVRNCSFSTTDGIMLILDQNSVATACKFSGDGTGVADYCIDTAAAGVVITGCTFLPNENTPGDGNSMIRVANPVTAVVTGCVFHRINQAEAYTVVGGGTLTASGNVYNDGVA